MDIAFFGVLSGSAISFLSIYATRLGATASQIGWISAVPAMVNLVFAIPVGNWLNHLSKRKTMFWSGLLQRFSYLLFALLPLWFNPTGEVTAIIILLLFSSIPGTGIAVGFNALFAEAVPMDWRSRVLGIRNAILSIVSVATVMICGQILTVLPFPLNYQIVFVIGFIGGMGSAVSLWFVHPLPELRQRVPVVEGSKPTKLRHLVFDRRTWLPSFNREMMRSHYFKIVMLLFFLHLSQFLALPLFPVYTVNHLKYSDRLISLGSGAFYLLTFLGSLYFEKLARRFSNRQLCGMGIMVIGIYPVMIAFSFHPSIYILANILAGAAYSLIASAVYNYVLEFAPIENRSSYLAWYAIAFNAAILVGSFLGPEIALWIGSVAALCLFGGIRFLAGAAILRWG